MPPGQAAGSYWDAIWSWANSVGLLAPPDDEDADAPRRKVPQVVCDNCPICQGAATVEAVNPAVLTELGELARTLLAGVGSALSQAADQRIAGGVAEEIVTGDDPAGLPPEPQTPAGGEDPD